MKANLDLDREIPVLDWAPHLAGRMGSMKCSAIRELLKLTQMPDVISFAGGMPAPEFFPLREVEEACRHILREEGARALQENYQTWLQFLVHVHMIFLNHLKEKDLLW